LFHEYNSPKIIVVGDFNDNPTDESINDILAAVSVNDKIYKSGLYNLSSNWSDSNLGTLKYQAQWDVFDQIIVSGSLLNAEAGFSTSQQNASIVQLPFLLEEDDRYGGIKPFRTYNGFQYLGGFSDHLPVLLKLHTEN
jgi:hypothetical protein